MELSLIDLLIVIIYILMTLFLGLYVSRYAGNNLQAYFLGSKRIPWYLLGFSNGSGMFDISGTAWTVSILFVYGLKSVWIPWLWPVWNQVFVMVFLAQWMRRSQVMTGAEWIFTRFGENRGGKASQIIVIVFAVISVIGFIAYFFEGIGKFAATILPWDLSLQMGILELSNAQSYALIILLLTTIYTIKGGFYSVVGTEVMQFLIMVVACVLIAVLAMDKVSADQIDAVVPDGWKQLFFGWELNLDWSEIFPAVNEKIATDGFGMFGALMMMMVFKGIFSSLAGPVPSYDMQRILSCPTPSDAARMSGFTILVLFFPRYLMVAGLGVLGLVYFLPELKAAATPDFEIILPGVISGILPVGIKGLVLAGLLAAFMSTFSAFVNAAPAYLVNDLYKKYLNPHASDLTYVRYSYLASILIVVAGILFGFYIDSLNSITLWLTSSLYGGYAASNVLKWIWWRFNGWGYFWGMLAGLLGSTVVPVLFPDWVAIYTFPLIFGLALAGSFFGCLLTRPVNERVLIDFYRKVRPWGWWKPVKRKTQELYPDFVPDQTPARDALNVVLGITAQMCLVATPILLVIREWPAFWSGIIILLICLGILKFSWWDRLKD